MPKLEVGMMVRVIDSAVAERGLEHYCGLIGTITRPSRYESDAWNLDTAEPNIFFKSVCLVPINPDNEAWGSFSDMMQDLTKETVTNEYLDKC